MVTVPRPDGESGVLVIDVRVLSLGGKNTIAKPFGLFSVGYQLRALLVHETFKKVLYISPSERGKFSSGRVFNLVTSDAETLQLLCQNIMGLISSPLRIIVAMLMLYFELGFSSLVALAVLLLLMPTQASNSHACYIDMRLLQAQVASNANLDISHECIRSWRTLQRK